MYLTSSIHATPGKELSVKADSYDALKARSFRPTGISVEVTVDEQPVGFQIVLYSHVGYPAITHGPYVLSPGSVRHFRFRWPPGEWWNAGTSNVLYEVYSMCLTNVKQTNADMVAILRTHVVLSDYTFSPSCPTLYSTEEGDGRCSPYVSLDAQ